MRQARRAVVDYARLAGFTSGEVHEIALAAGEALANAVEHGNKALGFIEVACAFDDGVLTIEITDTGPGFDVAAITQRRRDPSAIRGFGISIMHAVMDGVQYERRGALVRLSKRRAAALDLTLRRSEEA